MIAIKGNAPSFIIGMIVGICEPETHYYVRAYLDGMTLRLIDPRGGREKIFMLDPDKHEAIATVLSNSAVEALPEFKKTRNVIVINKRFDVYRGVDAFYAVHLETDTEICLGDGAEVMDYLGREYGIELFDIGAFYLNFVINSDPEEFENAWGLICT